MTIKVGTMFPRRRAFDGASFLGATVVSTGGSLTGSDVTSDEIIAFALPKK